METASRTSIARPLKRSGPLLEQPLLHDGKRVTGVIIERLLAATRTGYKLTEPEQYLLALAARMHAAIARDEATALYELKKRDGVAAA